ncbi:hypothetical protein CHS0354_033020 [Potamilus streckersoni]|uniref:NADH dehydrogenase [ubiquinone] 1 alpha subcomplex subunit 5 n=1 Tax=Potamilus streckersoni TaxID=2493646 RepID=A0AAE0RX27_9BIVA|nr:hypothetical protein CHS0354_033020 [Potamilus streckersoni]
MAGVSRKITTGLTGLKVINEPHEMLKVLYEKILIALDKIPATAAYRVNTEQIVRNRMQHVLTERNVQVLEQKIDGGQIEEVILQAKRELALARKMIEWKPWEPLVAQAPKNQWKWPF